MLGGPRDAVESGFAPPSALRRYGTTLTASRRPLGGYKRVKIKIARGSDVKLGARCGWPAEADLPLMVEANGDYTLKHSTFAPREFNLRC